LRHPPFSRDCPRHRESEQVRDVLAWAKAQTERCKRITEELTMEELRVILAEPENRLMPEFEVDEKALVAYAIQRAAYRLAWILIIGYLNEATRLDFGHFAE
jgi:hypothetical protein